MSDQATGWVEANQRFLTAAVDVVRALLERRTGAGRDGGGDVDGALAALAEAEAGMPAPAALRSLAETFGLTEFERHVLVLCAAVELDSRVGALLASAGSSTAAPTFSLALGLLPGAHWSAIGPAAPLRRWRLVELGDGGPVTASPLRMDERVLHHLAGAGHLDVRVAAMTEAVAAGELVPGHERLAARVAACWARAGEGPLPLLELWGPSAELQRQVAAAACARLGLRLHSLAAVAVPADLRELDVLVRLLEREARLGATAFLVDCSGLDAGDPAREHAVDRLLEECEAPLLLLAAAPRRRRRDRPAAAFEVPPPGAGEQRAMWTDALGDLGAGLNGTLDRLVSQFSLSPAQIRAACAQARAELATEGGAGAGRTAVALWDACRAQAHFDGGGLAERLEPVASWADLVLPEPQVRALREIALHVAGRYRVYESWGFGHASRRGLGVSALFTGTSGTGKTMAAEVLARDLCLDLYRIDLSQVVSKYIGETEKNLRRVFDAAEAGGAILLFDEADALFGKRTEVRDSHDRYANIEVGYLLQRMEAYRGLAVLTTNVKDALDPAFLRRLRFTVSFPFPDEAMRAEIWRRVFPAAAPTEGLDVARLARLNVAGGSIRSIALGAAFRAAAEDRPVRMTDLVEAARGEYAKLQQPLTEAELGAWA